MSDVLRILLVGDPEVGKSSIISTYTSRHFPDDGVPSIIYDSKLPPDSTANGTFVVIMDSNARSGNNKSNSSLTDKILIADSIVCVYDVTRPETLESIANEWLPLIKDVISSASVANAFSGNVTSNLPDTTRSMPSIIVAGNKTDLLNDLNLSGDLHGEEESELKYFSNLLSEFPFVKYCCRCSAKLLDVDSVFYYAENVITFPIDPLYDVLASDFTPQAVAAFKRIFRLFDEDYDGYLSDAEIATLQLRCFQIEFANDEIVALKKHIIKDVPGGLENNKITFIGFLGMIRKFIEKRSNLETAWIILRTCGYQNCANLTLEMPPDVDSPPPTSSTCSPDELTAWRRLMSGLKMPVSGPAKVPAIKNTNSSGSDVAFSSDSKYQLATLQEQQQYSVTGLSREAVQFLVALVLVAEEDVRRCYRREIAAASAVAGDAAAERTRLLASVLDCLGSEEVSQVAIEEVFSVLPRASCVFPVGPATSSAPDEPASDISSTSHPWSTPPLFTPTSTAANTVYCLNGYYTYSLPGSDSNTGSCDGSPDPNPDSVPASPSESVLSAGSAGMGIYGDMSTEQKSPCKALGGLGLSSGGLAYVSVGMWIAHWQLLAMFEPTMVQKLLFELGFVAKPGTHGQNHYGLLSNRSTDRYSRGFQQLRTVNTAVHFYPSRGQSHSSGSGSGSGDDNMDSTAGVDEATRSAMYFLGEVSRSAGCHGGVNNSNAHLNTDTTLVTKTPCDVRCAVLTAVCSQKETCTVCFSSIDVPALPIPLSVAPTATTFSVANSAGLVKQLQSAVVTTYSLCLSASDFYAADLQRTHTRCDLHLLLYANSSNSSVDCCLAASKMSQVTNEHIVPYVATRGDNRCTGVVNPALELTCPRLFVMLPPPVLPQDIDNCASATEGEDPALIITRHKLQEHISDCQWHPCVELQRVQADGDVSFGLLNKAVFRLTSTVHALESVSANARVSLLAQYRAKNSLMSVFRRMLGGSGEGDGSGLSLGACGMMGVGLLCSAASATSAWYYIMYFALKKPHPLLAGRSAEGSGPGWNSNSNINTGTGAGAMVAHLSLIVGMIHRMVAHDLGVLCGMLSSLTNGLYQQILTTLNFALPSGKWSLGSMYEHAFSLIPTAK